jgi:hypothetical protein
MRILCIRQRNRSQQILLALLTVVAVSAIFAGCGGGGGTSGSGTGRLSVVMVDAPAPSVTSVVVTIDRVEAHVNNDWVTITTTPLTFDLLDHVKVEQVLGTATLPVGHYTQVRFFPTAVTVTDATGPHQATIPSGVQSGIKVNVDYNIGPNLITTILLDFNVQKSIVQNNGGYLLQPVIPAVVKVLSGTVTGTVTSGGQNVQGATITATYTAGSNYPLGTEVNTAMTLADGTFKVWALLPGTYTITATHPTDATKTATVTGVVVAANQNKDVGTLDLQ